VEERSHRDGEVEGGDQEKNPISRKKRTVFFVGGGGGGVFWWGGGGFYRALYGKGGK